MTDSYHLVLENINGDTCRNSGQYLNVVLKPQHTAICWSFKSPSY